MNVLALVFDDGLRALVETAVTGGALRVSTDRDKFFEEADSYADGTFDAVICEVTSPEFANEVGQIVRNQCPRTPSFAVALDRTTFQPKVLKKNGFTDAFLLPLERQEFLEQLSAHLSSEALSKRMLKRVLLPDLQAGTTPPFTTYVHLPLNDKYLVYSTKDQPFSEKKVAKLRDKQVGTLFIDHKEADSFYTYVATGMRQGDNTLSATERQEKIKDSVRQVFTEVFDAVANDTMDSGRELLDSCRKMVSSYVLNGAPGDFHARLLRNVGGGGLEYTHAADVSTIAALIGMALGVTGVEDVAIAGFLHDIGLADFPVEHGWGPDPAWTDEVKKLYFEHPTRSVNLIKTKKMIVSARAETMILQHHERFDGKGFPRGLIGERVNREGQILSIADQFQYRFAVAPGQRRPAPVEIFDEIAGNGSIGPELMRQVREALKI